MFKRLLLTVLLLMCLQGVSAAKAVYQVLPVVHVAVVTFNPALSFSGESDTTKAKKRNAEAEEKKKIKEIAKARRQAKPEKLVIGQQPADSLSNKLKVKAARQRRPDGLERPPEIPRRNN